MTDEQLYFVDTFADGSASGKRRDLNWPELAGPPLYEKIENGGYHIIQTAFDSATTAILNPERHYRSGNEYDADITIDASSQPEAAAGIVFRWRSDDEYYVFAVDGLSRYSIWLRKGKWQELRNALSAWSEHDAVKPIGETNHLRLIDEGDRLIGYVNQDQVFDLNIQPQIDDGAIGIYLATTKNTGVAKPHTEIVVQNYSAQPYVEPTATVESMVDFGTPTPLPTLMPRRRATPTVPVTPTARP